MNKSKGFTIIEVLIVLSIFSVVALVTTQTIVVSLRTTIKTQNILAAKQDLDNAVATIERQVRNADDIYFSDPTKTCEDPYPNPLQLQVIDQDQNKVKFVCDLAEGKVTKQIVEPQTSASGGFATYDDSSSDPVRISSPDIEISACSFSCSGPGYPDPIYVDIDLEALKTGSSPEQNYKATSKSQILIRNY